MKTKIFALILCICLMSTGVSSYSIRVTSGKEDVKRYVAISRNSDIDKKIMDIDGSYKKSVKDKHRVYTFSAQDNEVETLEKKKDIVVSEDIKVSACSHSKNKKSIKQEWNMELIDNIQNYHNKTQDNINIAILDSGVDFSTDINVVETLDLVDKNNECNLFADITGHGTSIAGIIASSGETEAIEGINKNVNIYSARILDENNNAPISRVVDAIYWAISKKVKIINISFGTNEDSEVLEKAIKDAIDSGILIIAAAGNTRNEILYPAAYDGVMSVGSVDSTGKISDFSSNDEEIDIMAPGEDVKSVGAFNGSIIVSGTSVSTPHVVGLASLLWEKDKNITADFIKTLIIESANTTKQDKSLKGIIDVKYALEIYDLLKERYNYSKTVQKEKYKNNKKINTSENNYVTGVWTYEGHEKAAKYAADFCDLTTAQISIIKIGAVYPDKKFPKMSDNPQWHTAPVTSYNNYISNYRCATKIARALKKGKKVNSSNIKRPKDMYTSNYNKMLKQVSSISWTKSLFGGRSVTNARKGYFAMGMALHVITDSFAHQAYVKKGGKWKHLNHNDDDCDNITKYAKRFKSAKEAAKEALATYCNGETGDHWDYVVTYNGFKLKRLKTYTLKQETYDNDFGDMGTINSGNID
ncbi:MAG TPA: hypothetical protein DCR28_04325 [Eubacterium sp.]|nr:hypothetical protein [Eubacterium sp.]